MNYINLRYSFDLGEIYVTYILDNEKLSNNFSIQSGVQEELVNFTLSKIKKIKFDNICLDSYPICLGERQYGYSNLKELSFWLGVERKDLKFRVIKRKK